MTKSAGLHMSLRYLLVVGCLFMPLKAFGEIRVWKSKSGSYEVRAELISSDAEAVTLATEDGREITVPLAKLSQADRDFVTSQAPTAAQPADAEKEIKQVVAQFYRAVGRDGDEIREFLTDEGRASYDRAPTFFQDVRGPDRGERPRVTKITVHDEDPTAVADYRLRLGGKTFRMQMLFRSQEDQWRVSAIVGPGPGGTKNKMDFDNAQATTGATTVSRTTPAAANTRPAAASPAAAADVVSRGADAYTVGFCAKCHGELGKGTGRGPDLTDDQWDHCDGSVSGIRQVLVSGVPKEQLVDRSRRFGMNSATNFVAQSELDALAEFVKSLGSAAD